jgi:hypothetical protein
MRKEQNYQLTMHHNTQSVCKENAALLETISAYMDAKLKIDNSISREEELASQQEALKKTSTTPKSLSRVAAGDAILDLSSKLMSYALSNGNMALYESVKLNKTTLEKSPDNVFELICGNIMSYAQENLEALADYSVTEQTITDDTALLNTFRNEMQKLADNKIALTEVTAQLEMQIKTTNQDLKTVDAMVNSMRQSQPAFYSTYWNARTIKKSGGAKVAAKGKVFDSVTKLPMPGAIMSIVPYNGTAKLAAGSDLAKNVKIKSAGGGFQLKSLPTGTYLFTVTYAGYADQETIVYINEGVLTQVEMPLTKIA